MESKLVAAALWGEEGCGGENPEWVAFQMLYIWLDCEGYVRSRELAGPDFALLYRLAIGRSIEAVSPKRLVFQALSWPFGLGPTWMAGSRKDRKSR